jgi:hypothetical protein
MRVRHLVEDDLGRQVVGCTAQRVRAVHDAFGEAEVRELDVAVLVQEQVLRLRAHFEASLPLEYIYSCALDKAGTCGWDDGRGTALYPVDGETRAQ